MKPPNSVDIVAWARYNEWLSGATRAQKAADEYAEAKKSAGARDSRVSVAQQHETDTF